MLYIPSNQLLFRYFRDWMNCVRIWVVGNACLNCLGVCGWLLHERTVVSTGFLAQASLPLLGEINRGSPRLFHMSCRSGDQLCFERESVSLKRGESRLSENAQKSLFLCVELSPRRRELAWARDLLAWARPFSLSEEAERECVLVWYFLCSWMFGMYLIGLLYNGMRWMNMHEWEGVWIVNDELGM